MNKKSKKKNKFQFCLSGNLLQLWYLKQAIILWVHTLLLKRTYPENLTRNGSWFFLKFEFEKIHIIWRTLKVFFQTGLCNQITGNYISENISQDYNDLKYMGLMDCLHSKPGNFPRDHLMFLFLGSIMSADVKAS